MESTPDKCLTNARDRVRVRDGLRVRNCVADSAASCLANRLGSKLPRIPVNKTTEHAESFLGSNEVEAR